MAIDFNAATHKIDCGSQASLDDLQTLTTCAWVNMDAYSADSRIWTKGYVAAHATFHYFFVSASGGLNLEYDRVTTDMSVTAAASAFTANPATGKWMFVAGMSDPVATANNKLFQGTTTIPAVEPTTYSVQRAGSGAFNSDAAVNLTIGQRGNDGANLDGKLAHLSIWPRLLTMHELFVVQMVSAYAAGLIDTPVTFCPMPPDYVLMMFFTDGATQVDRSPFRNDGTVTGAVPYPPTPRVSDWPLTFTL